MANKRSWLSEKLEVRKSKSHRKGVFANAHITKGERLANFGGDIMWIDEIDRLPRGLQEYPMQIEERFVLGSRIGREPEDTDFFNHSCEPDIGFKDQSIDETLASLRDLVPLVARTIRETRQALVHATNIEAFLDILRHRLDADYTVYIRNPPLAG